MSDKSQHDPPCPGHRRGLRKDQFHGPAVTQQASALAGQPATGGAITGEKFTIGQERFAPQYPILGCSAPQANCDAPAMKQVNIKHRWYTYPWRD